MEKDVRAWPGKSAIMTSSGCMCPSHQEWAWGAAEVRQEKVLVEVLRKALLPGNVGVFVEHIYKCFLSALPRRESLRSAAVLRSRCQAFWPSPTSTLDRNRTSKWRHHICSGEHFTLFFLFLFSVFCIWRVCMGVWELMWVNVFRMSLFCTDSGLWRKMSRAWPAMSAIMTSLGSTCLSHQESARGAAEDRQERARSPLTWSSAEEHLPSFLKVTHQYTGQEEDQ